LQPPTPSRRRSKPTTSWSRGRANWRPPSHRVSDPGRRDAALRRLRGLENHLWILICEKRERAVFDMRQMTIDRIRSVQPVRFPVGPIDRAGLLALAEIGQLVD